MKFTLNWLKDHLETDASLQEVIEALRSKKDFPSEIVQEHVNWALLEQKRKLLNE